ncbi:MAG: hypothetical protein EHM58_04565 [Ignavibacteriae bacterium]|nr:MAG: hypothetical protein EHM58_04565 [Ignavibacteriota bacterium]
MKKLSLLLIFIIVFKNSYNCSQTPFDTSIKKLTETLAAFQDESMNIKSLNHVLSPETFQDHLNKTIELIKLANNVISSMTGIEYNTADKKHLNALGEIESLQTQIESKRIEIISRLKIEYSILKKKQSDQNAENILNELTKLVIKFYIPGL